MTTTLEDDITGALNGPIDEVIDQLTQFKGEWPEYNLYLVVCKSYDDAWVELRGARAETYEEREVRLKKEREKAEKTLERKRKQYNKLKTELGYE